jgi:hypothetical protein
LERFEYPRAASICAHAVDRFDVIRFKVGCLLIHAANQVEQFDLAKLGRMAFCLERNVALTKDLAGSFLEFRTFGFASQLRL